VPVTVTNDTSTTLNILGIDLFIDFDPSLITVSNVRAGAFTTSFTAALFLFDNATGQISATQSTATGKDLLANATAQVLLFDVTATSALTPGLSTPINILANRGANSITAINEDANLLRPAPTNASNDPGDGLITAVPEPSSVVLMGIGGLVLAYGARRRLARA
jgi:hypothetical protein